MGFKSHPRPFAHSVRIICIGLLIASAYWVSADDRDLLRNSSGDPFVEILLDTSGSMHWTPPCNAIDACLDIDPWDGMCTTECPLGDELCQQVCPNEGCVEYDFAPEEPYTHEIKMDTEDGVGIEIEGDWLSSSTFSPYKKTGYLHNGNSGQGDKSVTFKPTIPASGVYQVYLFWNANEFRASNVPVRIVHANGEDTILVDQGETTLAAEHAQGIYDYNWIGTFEFDKDADDTSITIATDDTDAFVVADGLRMFGVAKPEDGSVTCLREGYRCQQPLCIRGDCQAPLNGDDPTSKLFLAKSALYEVLGEAPNVHFGFATYEQDNARLKAKHWLYEVMETQPDGDAQDLSFPTIFGYTFPATVDEFPAIGSRYVFGNGAPYDSDGLGDGWNCANYDNPSDPSSGTVDYPGKEDGAGNLIDSRGDAALVSCFYSEPADLDDDWELERARRLPKLGLQGDEPTSVWYRDSDSTTASQPDGRIIRVDFLPVAGYAYGDDVLAVDVEAHRCFGAACSGGLPMLGGSGFSIATNRVYFRLVSDFVSWEDKIGRTADKGLGYFHDLRNVEVNSNMDCEGLELNDDRCRFTDCDEDNPDLDISEDDYWYLFTFKRPTTQDPRGDEITLTLEDGTESRAPWFDIGDFLPMDWDEKHRDLVKERLAPNMVGAGSGTAPDFRTAVYWDDTHIDGDEADEGDPLSPTNRRLAISDDSQLPLLPIGQTPIAASLEDFRVWFAGDEGVNLNGWSGVAVERDIDWSCREKFVLFLTDGNETCGGDPCEAARQLFDAGVSTYVIGFGLDNSQSTLGCIAEKGGTGEPLFPRNKDDLVAALRSILSDLKSESRSFASASIPAIQSTAADKIFLSSFIPLPGTSVWPGEIDAFRKPLPLDDQKRPDTSRKCSEDQQAACHLWEVGEIMLEQTPTNEELRNGDYHIGPGSDERRVFYPQSNPNGKRPSELVLFRPPYTGGDGSDTADLEDLAEVLVDEDVLAQYIEDQAFIAANPGLTEEEIEALVTAEDLMEDVTRVVSGTLRRKSLGTLAEADRTHYIMGDIFHSNPAVIAGPSDLAYFSGDLCGKLQSGETPNNCVDGVDRGYRRFAREHIWRRRLLVAATNDGQLHFIDGGTRVEAEIEGTSDSVEVFTDGTGRELFSYIPRLTLPIVRDQALGDTHIFSLDGNLVVRDVFIDPEDATGSANPADRQWRTVLMAGLREGGDLYENADDVPDFVSGYFALDITQPDILVQRETDRDTNGTFNDPPQESLVPVNSSLTQGTSDLPSCLDFDYDTDGHQKDVVLGGTFGCRGAFPSELWSFTDTAEQGRYFLDEEDNGDGTYGNGVPDLGDTWSTPVIGQIAVCGAAGGDCNPAANDDDLTSRHVAIFGGGMDAKYKASTQRGYWIYMVDMETGEAIFKRRLDGAAPADPAVLDTDSNGLLDTIYIGTTNGTLYKVDLTALDNNGDVPHLDAIDMRGKTLPTTDTTDAVFTVQRVVDDGAWDPFPILETYNNTPIYFPPSAFFIPQLNRYGLTLGTGDREDLWVPTDKQGRVYTLVDEGFTSGDLTADTALCDVRLPIVDECLESLAWDADPPLVDEDSEEIDNSINYLLEPDPTLRRGYVVTFPERFRLTAQPFVLTGILIFPIFEPIAFIPDVDEIEKVVCGRTGVTRSFVVLAQNFNPVARLSGVDQGEDPDVDGEIIGGDGTVLGAPAATTGSLKSPDRYHRIAEFTTAPFVDNVATKNDPNATGPTVSDLVEEEVERGVREAIMSYFPRGSRFNDAYRVAITAMRVTTGLNVYATIPQAIYPADWRDQ